MAHLLFRRSKELLQPLAAAGLAVTLGCNAKTHTACEGPSTGTRPPSILHHLTLNRRAHAEKLVQREKREQLGWKRWRTEQSRALVGDKELVHIASLINKLVDLESWDEDQEEELFEHAVSQCVEQMCTVLPPPFYDLLHTPYGCLEEETVTLLSDNLIAQCKKECNFPFLDEQDKRRIIRAVVWCVLEAMSEGKTLEKFAANLDGDEVAQDIIIEVFIEGAMDVFFDDEMRKQLVQDVTSYIEDVPFIPHALIERFCEALMKAFSGILHEALKEAFTSFKSACLRGEKLPILPAPLEDTSAECARVVEYWKDRPFVVQLRRVFIVNVLASEEAMSDTMGFSFLLDLMPKRAQAFVLGRLIDTIFHHLPGLEKIEATIQPFHDVPHDHAHHHLESQEHSDDKPKQPIAKTPEPEPVPRVSPEDEIATRFNLNWGRWHPCFISLNQPFGFSTVVDDDHVQRKAQPAHVHEPEQLQTPTPARSMRRSSSYQSDLSSKGSSPKKKMEAELLDKLNVIKADGAKRGTKGDRMRTSSSEKSDASMSLEAQLLGKVKSLQTDGVNSALACDTGQSPSKEGQAQRIAALKVAIVGLETYLGSGSSSGPTPRSSRSLSLTTTRQGSHEMNPTWAGA